MVPDDLPDLLRSLGRILVEMYCDDMSLLRFEFQAFLANLSDSLVHREVVTEGSDDHRFILTFSPEPEHRLPHPLRETVSHTETFSENREARRRYMTISNSVFPVGLFPRTLRSSTSTALLCDLLPLYHLSTWKSPYFFRKRPKTCVSFS